MNKIKHIDGFYEKENDGIRDFYWMENVATIEVDVNTINILIIPVGSVHENTTIKIGDKFFNIIKGWQILEINVDENYKKSNKIKFSCTANVDTKGLDSRNLSLMIGNIECLNDINEIYEEKKAIVDNIELLYVKNKFSTEKSQDMIIKELQENDYELESINFTNDDIVIDIGAHMGLFSIYLAKKYPFLQIISLEPIPDNYRILQRNVEINNVVDRVHALNMAVTGDRRNVEICVAVGDNSGGASACLSNLHLTGHRVYNIPSLTLEDIFNKYNIIKCKLLKIDCEGSEYDILEKSKLDLLKNIEFIRGEFHINSYLQRQGYDVKKLVDYLKNAIPGKNIKYVYCKMHE
ncbi:FkbM family methyltransferase [Pectinatus frisingensis]|uniref:FkbM family methyltransferase n=1 Tax=Pectinatus frisingensis TaxID=865 RepID=UPI003D8021A2